MSIFLTRVDYGENFFLVVSRENAMVPQQQPQKSVHTPVFTFGIVLKFVVAHLFCVLYSSFGRALCFECFFECFFFFDFLLGQKLLVSDFL